AVPALPTARSDLAAVAALDGDIYALGGTSSTGAALGVVEAYDPDARTWRSVAPLPTTRAGLAAAVGADGRIYALGGYAGGRYLSTVVAYSPATRRWTTV